MQCHWSPLNLVNDCFVPLAYILIMEIYMTPVYPILLSHFLISIIIIYIYFILSLSGFRWLYTRKITLSSLSLLSLTENTKELPRRDPFNNSNKSLPSLCPSFSIFLFLFCYSFCLFNGCSGTCLLKVKRTPLLLLSTFKFSLSLVAVLPTG